MDEVKAADSLNLHIFYFKNLTWMTRIAHVETPCLSTMKLLGIAAPNAVVWNASKLDA